MTPMIDFDQLLEKSSNSKSEFRPKSLIFVRDDAEGRRPSAASLLLELGALTANPEAINKF